MTGTKPTGFDADNLSVSLSAPTGSATIGVDPASHRLLHRGSNGAVTDISFLAQTDEAIYHPSGKRIAAVGTDANGAYGIWLSSNTGADPKQILSVEDPTKPVTDLSFSADGSILRFIHGFVHELVISNLQLFEEPFILVDPESGVSLSVMTTAIFMYRLAFSDGDFGTASAVSWLLFFAIAVLTWGNSKLFGRSEGQHAA